MRGKQEFPMKHPMPIFLRAECRAAPKPVRIPSGAEPGHKQSGGLFVPGEGLGLLAQRGLQGWPTYPSDEGLQ